MTTTHQVILGDCLAVADEMGYREFDLTFTSPPYEDARTYGMDYRLKGKEWVEWTADRFAACYKVTKGLTAFVVEGRTRNFEWSATPAMLMVELQSRGVKLRKPPVYNRVGIPGSGGPDWLRNDYEFIICGSHGRLPWSDNTACGHEPKYGPGGAPSHRKTDGTRVSKKEYKPPVKANPGNVFFLSKFIEDVCDNAVRESEDTGDFLRDMRIAIASKNLSVWIAGVYSRICKKAILRDGLQGDEPETSGWPEARRSSAQGEKDSQETCGEDILRDLQFFRKTGSSPQRWGRDEQRSGKSFGSVPEMPQDYSQKESVFHRRLREEILRDRVLLDALPAVEKIWNAFYETDEQESSSRDRGEIVRCVAGGGNMGSKISAETEAPFPEKLAEFFILSFCPPGGTVFDPFCGSGTVASVCKRLGRNSISVDCRQSQVDLTLRRLEETP